MEDTGIHTYTSSVKLQWKRVVQQFHIRSEFEELRWSVCVRKHLLIIDIIIIEFVFPFQVV